MRDLATTDPTAPQHPRRVRGLVKRLLLLVFGRPIVCAACGRELFIAIPIVRRGQVRLFGLPHGAVIRVEFSWTDRLEFRHVELDHCPAPARPWAS